MHDRSAFSLRVSQASRSLLGLGAVILVALIWPGAPIYAQDKDEGRITSGADAKPETEDKDAERIKSSTAEVPVVRYDIGKLPEPVQKMRNWIISAARSGDMERMRPPLESGELPPAFSFGSETDAIAYWRKVSRDGEGREILAEMLKVLSAGFTVIDPGTADELFVWPYHAVYPLNKLTGSQKVEFFLLVNPDDARTMEESGVYFGYRAGISADGTWQFFVAGD